MSKNNWFVFTLALIAAALLFVCYLLVGCYLDPPLLVLWLVLLLVGAIIMTVLEKKRRELLRRVYVVGAQGFNTSVGELDFNDAHDFVEKAEKVLANIDYETKPVHAPESFDPAFAVITDAFDVDAKKWSGKVVNATSDNEQVAFNDAAELESVVAKYW